MKKLHEYWHTYSLMQSIILNTTSHLQLYSTKMLGYYINVQVDSKLIDKPATSTNML